MDTITHTPQSLKIVLISGSLRAQSANTAALRTVAGMSWPGVDVRLFQGMSHLPHFNPDDDIEPLPNTVKELRQELSTSDGVLLSTPEYAASLPGSFKNLIDWTIGGAGLYQARVGWINISSSGGSIATYKTLRSILEMAGAVVVADACRDHAVRRDALGADGVIADPEARNTFRRAMQSLIDHIRISPRT